MSLRLSSNISKGSDMLAVIREDQKSPTASAILNPPVHTEEKEAKKITICPCKGFFEKELGKQFEDEKAKLLKLKEEELKRQYEEKLDSELNYLKERFNFILRNEQIRSSCMLREAYRERKEKIQALQTQLECKNLASLMYVMCSERRKCKMEILRLSEEYTKYIESLQQILSESQSLILNLSRGYKTAARVDNEWREKMMKVIKEFQKFVYHFAGGGPDVNQYFFDIPNLLKIQTPTVDNPNEDPCDVEDVQEEEQMPIPEEEPRCWWDNLDAESHPFIVFGDMADFKPPQRREVLKSVKAAKTAPAKWKEYSFNNTFLKEKCDNMKAIKDKYNKHRVDHKWECNVQADFRQSKQGSESSRRITTASVDIRTTMGSFLKMITLTAISQQTTRATLLAARDSMEIASASRLREKHRQSHNSNKVVLNIGNKANDIFDDTFVNEELLEELEEPEIELKQSTQEVSDEPDDTENSVLLSAHNDSLQVIPTHVPDHDHKINYDRVCPEDKCQRMHVDEFTKSLPPYMRASPFTHFEQTYDEYETCSPEQLEILKQRLEEKKKKEKVDFGFVKDNPLSEWTPSNDGMAIQTSEASVSIPPCTCGVPSPTPAPQLSEQRIFTMADIFPAKERLDVIKKEHFFKDNIEFNRFKVVGEDDKIFQNDFKTDRLHEIENILQQHPSLCEIFHGTVPI